MLLDNTPLLASDLQLTSRCFCKLRLLEIYSPRCDCACCSHGDLLSKKAMGT